MATSTSREKYAMERRLGGGGMAEVFLARTVGAEGFSRQVAIKRVLPGLSENPHFSQLFVSEANLTSRLRHANIVSTLDFDRDEEGRLFLVMELVDGVDLCGLLETGPLPFSTVIFIVTEILRGLAYAHELPISHDGVRGVVHRDISPHNVLLGWDASIKVSDFGIAKTRAATNATASQIIKGKPAYMSPEQAKGWPLDGRSDLFAVGVMLFEMLCLRPLFAGDTAAEVIARLLFEAIPDPRELRPEIPEDLARVVTSLLVRERDQRMPSASAALAALVACADYPRDGREELVAVLADRFIGRAPVHGHLVPQLSYSDQTLVPRWAASGTPARPTATGPYIGRTSTASPGWRPTPTRNHRRRWRWALVVTLLAFGGTIGVLAMTSSSSSTASEDHAATSSQPAAGSQLPAPSMSTPASNEKAVVAAPAATAPASSSEPSGSAATVTVPSAPNRIPSHDRSSAPHPPARPSASPTTKPSGIREVTL